MMVRLEPNRHSLKTFITTMFKHASKGTIAALCAFYDDHSGKIFKIKTVPIGDDLTDVIKTASQLAQHAANTKLPIGICLPVASFNSFPTFKNAKLSDICNLKSGLAEGLALSVDFDWSSSTGRTKLERLLGPPTVVVASGGTWPNPETGLLESRLHLHWRLSVPARGTYQLRLLRRARMRLCVAVNADLTVAHNSQPLRCPGSWHRKDEPVLCRMLAINPKREISLKHLRYIYEMPDGLLDHLLERRDEPPEGAPDLFIEEYGEMRGPQGQYRAPPRRPAPVRGGSPPELETQCQTHTAHGHQFFPTGARP